MKNTLSPSSSSQASEISLRPSLLPATEVARILAISQRTLWRLESAGRLPRAVRIGGSVRWRQDELYAWIEAGCPRRNAVRRQG